MHDYNGSKGRRRFALPQVATVWDLEKKTIRRRNPTRKEEILGLRSLGRRVSLQLCSQSRRHSCQYSSTHKGRTMKRRQERQHEQTRIGIRIRLEVGVGVGVGDETNHANIQFSPTNARTDDSDSARRLFQSRRRAHEKPRRTIKLIQMLEGH